MKIEHFIILSKNWQVSLPHDPKTHCTPLSCADASEKGWRKTPILKSEGFFFYI